MPETMNLSGTNHAVVAVVAMQGPNREQCVRNLCAGQDLLVGSEDTADLRAVGEGVSAMHCLIRSCRGSISVRDLYSHTGTWVGEHRVSEFPIVRDSVVRVGDFTVSITLGEMPQADVSIVPELHGMAVAALRHSASGTPQLSSQNGIRPLECEPRTARHATASVIAQHREQAGTEMVAPFSQRESKPVTFGGPRKADAEAEMPVTPQPASLIVPFSAPKGSPPEESGSQTIRRLESQLKQANAEIGALKDRLEFAVTQVPLSGADPWQDEMIGLLRAEVVELQTALAEKNLENSGSSNSGEDLPADSVSHDESERLIERLEQLLLELHQRDEQVELLNDLLEAAENANRAEQEERQRINVWVSDIENRIGRQEEEWQAERQKLQETIEKLTAARDRAEATIAADTAMERNEGIQRVINGLRDEVETLRGELSQSTASCVELRRGLDEANRKDFREEAVQIAQERAELARLRYEIETSRQPPSKHVETSDSNLRFRALREHLNEIHDKEKDIRANAKLGSRISRLWTLLERRKS